jgi:hypothetical protein
VADRADAVQVGHLAFETASRKRHVCERVHSRITRGHNAFELDPAVRPAGQEHVYHPQPVTVVVGRYQGQPKPGRQQFLRFVRQRIARKPVQHQIPAHRCTPT